MNDEHSSLALHHRATIIDSTAPLITPLNLAACAAAWRRGGVTAFGAEVASNHSAREAIASLSRWRAKIRSVGSDLRLITQADDIRQAKEHEQLGAIFHFQNTRPIEHDVGLLEIFHSLGVRIVQLTYNRRNLVGDGCEEPVDAGLSMFGKTVVRQMNELGLVIDLSHTGERTTLEAIELSDYPCIFSHSNVNTIRPNDRNLSDDQIRAAAANGGVVGIAGFPSFVSSSERPKIDEFVAHIEYISELVGADHVGLGIDYASNPTGEEFDDLIEIGKWLPANYQRPPWHYPLGMEDVTLLPNLTEQLLQRGFSTEDIMKILGGNFLRVFQAVWG